MFRFFITLLFTSFFLLVVNPINSLEIPQKRIDKLTDKVSKKFSRTYCNTSKFGISNEGALEFAIGETNKEFSNNKLLSYVNPNDLKSKILINIENDCQVYDFPSEELAKINLD